jgi:hypothetical protein
MWERFHDGRFRGARRELMPEPHCLHEPQDPQELYEPPRIHGLPGDGTTVSALPVMPMTPSCS